MKIFNFLNYNKLIHLEWNYTLRIPISISLKVSLISLLSLTNYLVITAKITILFNHLPFIDYLARPPPFSGSLEFSLLKI